MTLETWLPDLERKYVVDLFSGEGGVSRGIADAGLIPVGVECNTDRIMRYPYRVFAGDWEEGLTHWLKHLKDRIAFITASPPCQGYSVSSEMSRAKGVPVEYPRLIEPVRKALKKVRSEYGIDYVIENVQQAPLENPVILCGSMFYITATWHDDIVGLKRHRGFEATWPIALPREHHCAEIRNVPVYGHGAPGYRDGDKYFCGRGFAKLTRDVMRIDWMTRRGLTEAIPPAYAYHVAREWAIANLPEGEGFTY